MSDSKLRELERHVHQAREHIARNEPLFAIISANFALDLSPAYQPARDVIKEVEPTARTGMALHCYSRIDLHEHGIELETIFTPKHKGLTMNDYFAHNDTLFVVYHDAIRPRAYVKLTPSGFSTLHQLPFKTTFPISDPEHATPLHTSPPHETYGIPIKIGKECTHYANPATRQLSRVDVNHRHIVDGKYEGIFQIDNRAVYLLRTRLDATLLTERIWTQLGQNDFSLPTKIGDLIDCHPNSRYLKTNKFLTTYDLTTMYADTDQRITRIAHEIPLTICDNIRAEAKRQKGAR